MHIWIKEILLSLLALLIATNQSFAFTVEQSHPRIFLDSSKVQTLRARVGVSNSSSNQYQTHVFEYGKVREAANEYSASNIQTMDGLNKGRMSLANAFVFLMEGDTSHFEKAKVLLDQIDSLDATEDKGHYGFMIACIIFDWLYNNLTSSERADYVQDIIEFVNRSSYSSTYDSFDPYYNVRKFPSSLYALSGQAIYNENPSTGEEYINRGITVFNRMMNIQQEIANDGFVYPIGQDGYFDESGWQPVLRVLAGLKLAGVSGPEIDNLEYGAIAKTAYGEIYSYVKDAFSVSHNDGYHERNGDQKPWRYLRGPEGAFYSSILATLHEGEEIGRLINYSQSKYEVFDISEFPLTYLGSILFNNKVANATGDTISNLPTSKLFDDSFFVYRSSWASLGSDNSDILFNFVAEKHVNAHTKFAKGHFDIWRGYDPLTFSSGDYSNTNYQHYLYYRDSLSANTMMIRNPSENTGAAPNDGGQLTNIGRGDELGVHNSSAWRTIGHTEEGGVTDTGRIKRSSIDSNHFYLYFHYPTAYDPAKVDDLSRSVVRLGDYFIIADRVNSSNSSYSKRWLLHSIGRPEIIDSGSWNGGTSLDSDGGTPNQTSSNGKSFRVSEGDSALLISSVYPTDTIVHRVGGSSAYRWYSYFENANYSQGAPDHGLFGNWRLEIESNTSNEDDLFISVLKPGDLNVSMPPIEALSGSNYRGIQLRESDGSVKVAIFSSSFSESTTEIGYSFTLGSFSSAQIVATDLSPGVYQISLAGVPVANIAAPAEKGSIYFETSSSFSGGEISISQAGDIKIPRSPGFFEIHPTSRN